MEMTKHPIMGKSQCTFEQMKKYLLRVNPKPRINCTVDELAMLYLDIGTSEGVRGDMAFAQAIKETGYWRFGGQVLPEQNNYAGLGAINNAPIGKGATFKTPTEGIRAHIQHLKAYASKANLNTPLVDPRFSLVSRGIAPNWEDLNGKWAVPGINYGEQIVAIWQAILAVPLDQPTCPFSDISGRWSEADIKKLWASGILASADQFRPKDPITREEMAAIISRVLDRISKI